MQPPAQRRRNTWTPFTEKHCSNRTGRLSLHRSPDHTHTVVILRSELPGTFKAFKKDQIITVHGENISVQTEMRVLLMCPALWCSHIWVWFAKFSQQAGHGQVYERALTTIFHKLYDLFLSLTSFTHTAPERHCSFSSVCCYFTVEWQWQRYKHSLFPEWEVSTSSNKPDTMQSSLTQSTTRTNKVTGRKQLLMDDWTWATSSSC